MYSSYILIKLAALGPICWHSEASDDDAGTRDPSQFAFLYGMCSTSAEQMCSAINKTGLSLRANTNPTHSRSLCQYEISLRQQVAWITSCSLTGPSSYLQRAESAFNSPENYLLTILLLTTTTTINLK